MTPIARNITQTEKRILEVINYFDTGEGCWASYGTIADFAECNERTVRRAMFKFQQLGLYKRVGTQSTNGKMTIHFRKMSDKGVIKEVMDPLTNIYINKYIDQEITSPIGDQWHYD